MRSIKQRPKLDFLRFRFTKCSKFHFLEKKDLRRILPVETHSFNHFVKIQEADSRSSPSAGWKRNSIFGWKNGLEFSLGLNGVCWVEDSSGPWPWDGLLPYGGRPAGCVQEVAWEWWAELTCGLDVQVLFWQPMVLLSGWMRSETVSSPSSNFLKNAQNCFKLIHI